MKDTSYIMHRLVAAPLAVVCVCASLTSAVAQEAYLRRLGTAVDDTLPRGAKARPISFMPGVVFKFGDTKYAMTGSELCPAPPLPLSQVR